MQVHTYETFVSHYLQLFCMSYVSHTKFTRRKEQTNATYFLNL